MTLKSCISDVLRGGTRKTISFVEFASLARKGSRPPFVVEEIVVPDLGDRSWGNVVIREGATRSRPKFRR